MKKVFILFAGLAMLTLSSCGSTTVCDCANAMKDMTADYQGDLDEEAMEKLEKKYAKISEECEALSKEMGQEEFQKAFAECK
jgi:hypothetical protein